MRTLTYWLSLLLIFTIPWEAVLEDAALGSIARLIGLALAASWIAMVALTGRIRRPTPFHAAVVLLVLWNALSMFWSADVNRTSEHITTWVQLAVMVFILWDVLVTPKAFTSALQMYVLGAYVVFGITVSSYFAGTTFYWERFSAGGTNPDDLGIVLALGIPLAWYLGAGKWNDRPQPLLLKWINYAYIPAALVGIALSGTRTALIAAVPGVLFGLVSISRVNARAKSAIAILFVCAAFAITPLIPQASFERLGTISTEVAGGDWNGRLELWAQGLSAFEENPILGVGSNTYRSVNIEGKVAHNSFLSVLVELGLVGFALFAIILTMVVIQAVRQPRWDSLFCLSLLAIWAIGAFTLTWEYRKPTWLFLCLVIVSSALSMPAAVNARTTVSRSRSTVERLPA